MEPDEEETYEDEPGRLHDEMKEDLP